MTHKTKIILGIVALVLIAGVIYVEYPKQTNDSAICTMEAKLCPDGSYVGRTGPSCEFSECPVVPATTTAGVGQKIVVNGVSVTPIEVVEDSRCPSNVQCIQAGTVRLKVRLESEGNVQEETLKIGTQITFAGKRVTLSAVLPVKNSTKVIVSSEYKFTFEVNDAVSVSKGTLQGSVTIGPVCPVENSAGYSCTPTPEMYAAAQIFVYLSDKTTFVTTIIPDKDGKFSISLPVGKYYIDMFHQSVGGTTGVPTTVNITSGKTVTLKLAVDTGLR